MLVFLELDLLTSDVVGTAEARAKRTLRTARIWAFIFLEMIQMLSGLIGCLLCSLTECGCW